MSLMKIDMPIVAECSATECAYNVSRNCHARAITIGNGVHPGCDTLFKHPHIENVSQTAGVGACKVTNCKYNADCECVADQIKVGGSAGAATCLTYAT